MNRLLSLALLMILLLALPGVGLTASTEELERRLDLITAELQKMKNETAVTDQGYSSDHGLGPAASKVYKLSKGLSIGGYGEAKYTNYVTDKGSNTDTADMVRLILYTGYKFSDKILFNSEIEFEHGKVEGGKDGGEVAIEFANIDFLLNEKVNLRAGLMLMPVGITNELHEPTLFHGNDRPLVESQVIPTTWRELGVGAFGQISEGLEYKLYLVNSLDASGFDSKGIRGGRESGSKAKAEDFSLVARLDYEPTLGLNLGGSAYLGNAGQSQEFNGKQVDVFTQIYEVHGQYKVRGLELKALASRVEIDDTEQLNGVPERVAGWYSEVAYDLLPCIVSGTSQYLAPFVRYENIDYAGSNQDVELWVSGLSYKPIPNVVVKADYRNFNNFGAGKTNTADTVNLGIGFIF